jgi:hypothetical protein
MYKVVSRIVTILEELKRKSPTAHFLPGCHDLGSNGLKCDFGQSFDPPTALWIDKNTNKVRFQKMQLQQPRIWITIADAGEIVSVPRSGQRERKAAKLQR